MNAELHDEERKITRIPVWEIASMDESEGVKVFYDFRNNTLIPMMTWEDGWKAIRELREAGKVIRIPTYEELYPYGQAMYDYLCDNRLNVPYGMSAKHYVHEKGRIHDFYAYRAETQTLELNKWLKEHNIDSIEVFC